MHNVDKPYPTSRLKQWLLFLLILASLPCESRVHSQHKTISTGFRFTTLSINDGLSQNLVSAIHQDKQGFLWIGTKDGLNMYDGYTFTIFRHNPFDPTSLSDNFIHDIYCDEQGRIWVGTSQGGLNLYNRNTGGFIRFVHDPANPNTISSNHVLSIVDDKYGNIWAGTSHGGLNKISIEGGETIPRKENITITRYTAEADGYSLDKATISNLFRDSRGNIWISAHNRVIRLETEPGREVFSELRLKLLNQQHAYPKSYFGAPDGKIIVFEDHLNDIWMLSRMGLFRYNQGEGIFTQFPYPMLPDFRNGRTFNPLAAAAFDNRNNRELWLSTEGGLAVLYPETGWVVPMNADSGDPVGMVAGNIISLYADSSGTLWIGSSGYGLSVFDPYTLKFTYPFDNGYDLKGLPVSVRDLSIHALFETTDGTLWIGSNRGFFRLDQKNAELVEVPLQPVETESNPMVFSIREGVDGMLWLATGAGLIRFNPGNHSYRIYSTGLQDAGGNDPKVVQVHLRGDEIWVLTPYTIALLDQESGSFQHVRYNDEAFNRFREPVFPCMVEDDHGNFWLGTHNGLHYFEVATRQMTLYLNDPGNPASLPFNNVRAILPDPFDPQRFLWIATGGGGIAQFDLQEKTFISFSGRHGLANNMVYGMLADDAGNFWLSTNHGLSRFNTESSTFFNYTVADGLQSNEFNSGAFHKSRSGELFLGGISGYNRFFPAQIKHKAFAAPLMFTAFNLISGEPENSGSTIHLSDKKHIQLTRKQNHFVVSFSALDLASAAKNQYTYSLSHKVVQWIPLGNNRSITFTNLKPGHYTLRVRGTNNDGIWSDKEAVMTISIGKPWWGTNLVLGFYVLLLFVLGYAIRYYELSRLRLRTQMKLSDLEARKLKDIDLMKSKFFANISHEFRTPLTLIKGPVEQMIEETIDPDRRQVLATMRKNTDRLMTLINQLLDLSKLESQQYNILVSRGDIAGFVKGFVMSFASLAEEKNIQLRYIEAQSLKETILKTDLYFNRDVMEKILTNLLSNAFKFTPAGGRVTVTSCLRQLRNKQHKFEITIRDTGIGIPREKMPFIYDRFYQVDDSPSRLFEGSGIGLAYVKELVDVHRGHIAAMSQPGKGTTFRIRFPLGRNAFRQEQIDDSIPTETEIFFTVNDRKEEPVNHEPSEPLALDVAFDKPLSKGDYGDPDRSINESGGQNADKPLVLVIEDHEEVRKYICNILANNYTVINTSNANEGIKMAIESIPDLIISDVMMPGTDGFACCERIKTNEKTSHIPFILLTARSDDTDRIHGLETGADDYLTKPFNNRELLLRVRNMIESRRVLRARFSGNAVIMPSEVVVSSRDSTFMEKLLQIVEENISREDFSIEDFGKEVGMSQSQLNRKLKALINQPANQFIRSVKMHRARYLLEKDAGNIADIAYMVGFSDPGYFTRTFKAFFGVLPSEVQKSDKL